MIKEIQKSIFLKHETKRRILTKFLLVVLVLVFYFVFVSYKFGLADGFSITFLSWSFFVLCTPVADAGFLLDFPLRLITGIRMLTSEIIVWFIAIIGNSYFTLWSPLAYSHTFLLRIFKEILTHPTPFWLIIFISFIGTFLSIYFGDELFDKIKHSQRKKHQQHKLKYRILVGIFLLVATFMLYDILLKHLGINIPL